MKKVFLILGAMLLTVVVAVSAVLLMVDPNQFKPVIVQQTKQQAGLDLIIEGDLSWSIYPSIGLSLGKTELRNPEGFSNENLLKIDSINVDISLLPMLSKELVIGDVSMDGAEIYLETLKNGQTNLDFLTKQEAQTDTTQPKVSEVPSAGEEPEGVAEETEQSRAWGGRLAGISITQARLEINNQQTGEHTKLYDVGLSVSEFEANKWTAITFSAKGSSNQQMFSASGQAQLKLSQGLSDYALKDIQLEAAFNDPTTDIASAKVSLDTFEFDKKNRMDFSVEGTAADTDIDLNGSSNLTIDKAISHVVMDELTLGSAFSGAALPRSPLQVDMNASLSFDINKQQLELALEKLALDDITLDGQSEVTLGAVPKVRFSLHSPDVDMDKFLGLNDVKAGSEGQADSVSGENAAGAEQTQTEPDLSVLKTLDIKGDIRIDKLKASNARMQNVNLIVSVNRGVVELSSFESELYDGSIRATAHLDARKTPATYRINKQIKGIKVLPLLKDVAGSDVLEGTGNIDVDVRGHGLTPSGIQKNLTGTVDINFADGAVNGINVAQLIRSNYAKLKGQSVAETNEPQKTDFTALTSTINLKNGVAETSNLHMQSPLLRIQGEGEANYIKQTIDFLINTSLVGTLEGQGGKDINELNNVTIPLRIRGGWSSPKFSIELAEILKQKEAQRLKEKAKEEAERGLKNLLGDKAGDDETKALTDKLFNKLFN
ncbi:AsmA family protein [Vibrio albus]|uniref:AsmA family protein n=1 Tax=Vibrio albus TaxID=2200953 RepID=A0A2U3BE18_9VIBR|nr:AsmA family protein [Vibrio albus]PWI35013.1 AsmA family protein [Vibrio albus]